VRGAGAAQRARGRRPRRPLASLNLPTLLP
jgi:hypothetical protein